MHKVDYVNEKDEFESSYCWQGLFKFIDQQTWLKNGTKEATVPVNDEEHYQHSHLANRLNAKAVQ